MKGAIKAKEKAIAVIKSVNSRKQYEGAQKYIHLFKDSYPEYSNTAYLLEKMLKERLG